MTLLLLKSLQCSFRCADTLFAQWYYEVADENLHGFVVLIEGGGANLDHALVRAGFGCAHADDLARDMQFIAGPHRARPAQLVEPRANETSGGLHVAVNQQPHGEG